MPNRAKLCIGVTIALGLAVLGAGLLFHWQPTQHTRYLGYLALAVLAATRKVRLPKIQGTISLNFLFILIGIAELSLGETLLLACPAAAVQCLWRPKSRPKLLQVLFNIATLAISATLAYSVSRFLNPGLGLPLLLALATFILYLSNTGLVSLVLSLLTEQPLTRIWRQCHLWTFPYYLAGAALVGVVVVSERAVGWMPALLATPVMYLIYLYYGFCVRLFAEPARSGD